MKILIGRKVKGFKFDPLEVNFSYAKDMDNYIGVIGVITSKWAGGYRVDFHDDFWGYPAELIEQHLID